MGSKDHVGQSFMQNCPVMVHLEMAQIPGIYGVLLDAPNLIMAQENNWAPKLKSPRLAKTNAAYVHEGDVSLG